METNPQMKTDEEILLERSKNTGRIYSSDEVKNILFPMKHLDLFSGIGGFSMAAASCGIETVGFSEIDPYACATLNKNFPGVKNYGDLRTIGPEINAQGITHLTGGFPCQPFSTAGKRRGKNDDRDLWPDMLEVIKLADPEWVIGENVAGFVSMELDRTVSDLEANAYSVEAVIIPACAVGAPHRRDRVWIIAHGGRSQKQQLPAERNQQCDQPAAHAHGLRLQGATESGTDDCRRGFKPAWEQNWYEVATEFCRVGNGVPSRMDRLKCLGNSIVPQVALEILKTTIR